MKLDLNTVKSKLNEKFVHCDPFAEAFTAAVNTNKNVMFYGKGGHAKSEMAGFLTKEFNMKPFVKAFGIGSSMEDLLGGLDMRAFQDGIPEENVKRGTIRYLIENSFMMHEYVVFEELFDAPAQMLTILKDILTSGYYRQGNHVMEIKTKCIIVLTNKTKEEIGEDDSTKALLERFPIEARIEWPDYSEQSFSNMFSKVLKDEMKTFSEILADIHRNGGWISPRTAIQAAEIMKSEGVHGLRYIKGFKNSVIDELLAKAEREEKNKRLEQVKKDLTNKIKDVISKILENVDTEDAYQVFKVANKVDELAKLIQKSVSDEEYIPFFNNFASMLEKRAHTIRQKMLNHVTCQVSEEEIKELENLLNKEDEKNIKSS